MSDFDPFMILMLTYIGSNVTPLKDTKFFPQGFMSFVKLIIDQASNADLLKKKRIHVA